VDESCKRVILIAASILAAQMLAPYDPVRRVPATISAIADAIKWAEEIMQEQEIDRRCSGQSPRKKSSHEEKGC